MNTTLRGFMIGLISGLAVSLSIILYTQNALIEQYRNTMDYMRVEMEIMHKTTDTILNVYSGLRR